MIKEAGIIAAGAGARLSAGRPEAIKPLADVAGTPLCHWVVRGLESAGVARVTFLHNSRGGAVRESLAKGFPGLRWDFLEADTGSSWESFRLVCRSLAQHGESFLISTVDALIPPREVARFSAAMRISGAAAGLALTSFVDDEKPLWADLSEGGRVCALGDAAKRRGLVTCGLYFMTGAAARALPAAGAHASLRGYWSALVASGAAVAGLALSKTIDVDRPEDVRQAEDFLRETSASW